MGNISRIDINGTIIEEKDNEIYINGKHIDTGKPTGMDLTYMFLFGVIMGCSALAIVLSLLEHLGKGLST